MSPKKTDTVTQTAVLEPEVMETALAPVTQNSQALAVPGDDANDTRGKEDFGAEDMIVPRLALAQSMTPQTKRQNKAHIEGLDEGMVFNTLTGEIFETPFRMIVLQGKKKAYVFDDQGKILERNIDFDSPRCKPPVDAQGNRLLDAKGKKVPSEASPCYEFLVYLPDAQNDASKVALLRTKRTQNGPAKQLISYLRVTPGASWNAVYPVTTVPDSFESFSFYNWKFGMGKKSTPEQRAEAEQLFRMFGGREIKTIEVAGIDVDTEDRGAMAADQGDGI